MIPSLTALARNMVRELDPQVSPTTSMYGPCRHSTHMLCHGAAAPAARMPCMCILQMLHSCIAGWRSMPGVLCESSAAPLAEQTGSLLAGTCRVVARRSYNNVVSPRLYFTFDLDSLQQNVTFQHLFQVSCLPC
jgi:hypothetical protein